MQDGQTTTSEDRATKLLICEALSFAIVKKNCPKMSKCWSCYVSSSLNGFSPIDNNCCQAVHLQCILSVNVYSACVWQHASRHRPHFSWPPPAVNTVLQNFAWWRSGRMCKKRHFTLIVGQLGKGKLTDCSHCGNHTVSWLRCPWKTVSKLSDFW